MDENAKRTRRGKQRLSATAYSDLRDGIDVVVRRDTRCFIVDPGASMRRSKSKAIN